ncbi:unnamed protein product [Parnassius mnemosyne]|uniref:Uncharacterized protein n=1 Tax=Parnassius mnemosyne TaxID=213953 RepID=A0AAV1LPM2_9NEOP
MNESTRLYGFTNTENMARLRNCLRGEAREVVSALLFTAKDPADIMRTLEQCFGRPEVIIDRALEELKRLPRPGQTAQELNSFAIKLQNIVCIMQNVDGKGYLRNPMLTREVTSKLSPHLRSRWCDYAEHYGSVDEPDIVTLSRFMMREADRKEALYDIQMETPKFLGPDLPDEPISEVKIMNIPTPRFLCSPKGTQATPSFTNGEVTVQHSDVEQLPLRWSDDGSQDGKSKENLLKLESVNDSDDISKTKEYIETSVTKYCEGSLHIELIKCGFDAETAKIIERDLFDSPRQNQETDLYIETSVTKDCEDSL